MLNFQYCEDWLKIKQFSRLCFSLGTFLNFPAPIWTKASYLEKEYEKPTGIKFSNFFCDSEQLDSVEHDRVLSNFDVK